ncbi:MAG: sigma-54 dependent transcriptional regulator [Pseudomonadota bacterium]
MKPRVMIVDDEPSVRAALAQTAELNDMIAVQAVDMRNALRLAQQSLPDTIITDITMPGGDGFALMNALREIDADLPVIMLTGNGDVPMAVRAMGDGAYDFIEKPVSPARLMEVVRRAVERRTLIMENRALKRQIIRDGQSGSTMIFGETTASRDFQDRLLAIAEAEVDVLIEGDTGCGKEEAARAIHQMSDRRAGPFVAVNCGALPPDIALAELFGYDAGAVPGAPPRSGHFEAAQRGIIMLDQIDAMPMEVQLRILRVLQDREIRRIGSPHSIDLDIRVIAISKTDLGKAVAQDGFRSDLYYQLDGARLHVPALRERIADVPHFFAALLDRIAATSARERPSLPADIFARLMAHDWPGNMRELSNVAGRFVQGLGLEIGGKIRSQAVSAAHTSGSLVERIEMFERQTIRDALTEAGGRVAIAADRLGLPRKTLYDKLARHGLRSADFKR